MPKTCNRVGNNLKLIIMNFVKYVVAICLIAITSLAFGQTDSKSQTTGKNELNLRPPNSDCEDFNDQSKGNWFTYNQFNGNVTNTTSNMNANTAGASGIPGDFSLETKDISGSTILINLTDHVGDFTLQYGSCLCLDYSLDIDQQGTTYPRFYLFSDFDATLPTGPSNPMISAEFIDSSPISAGSGWSRICMPIDPCTGGILPSNNDGSWNITNGTGDDCVDWANLMSFVGGFAVAIDVSYFNVIHFLNF